MVQRNNEFKRFFLIFMFIVYTFSPDHGFCQHQSTIIAHLNSKPIFSS